MTRKVLPHIQTLAAGVLLFLAAGCAYVAPTIQLQGTARDLERLSGEWLGEYVGDHDHRRRGSISFTLVAGDDFARGDVLMIPENLDRPYRRYTDPSVMRNEPMPQSSVLTIRFVIVDRDIVRGELDPYWDPDRSTGASASFVGRLTDDVIEGTFTTTYVSGLAQTGGRWKVVRSRNQY